MRLAILDSGHGFGSKVLFALIRAVSRQPVPDVIKLNRYRADFYGTPMTGPRTAPEDIQGRRTRTIEAFQPLHRRARRP
jgi:hypothetical protein